MRRAAKIDANQPNVVAALRASGVGVHIASDLGGGFLDLVCSRDGFTALLEVKDGTKPPSARKLTDDQVDFTREWKGAWAVVEDAGRAVEIFEDLKATYDTRVLMERALGGAA